jgi:hypothetical protein
MKWSCGSSRCVPQRRHVYKEVNSCPESWKFDTWAKFKVIKNIRQDKICYICVKYYIWFGFVDSDKQARRDGGICRHIGRPNVAVSEGRSTRNHARRVRDFSKPRCQISVRIFIMLWLFGPGRLIAHTTLTAAMLKALSGFIRFLRAEKVTIQFMERDKSMAVLHEWDAHVREHSFRLQLT